MKKQNTKWMRRLKPVKARQVVMKGPTPQQTFAYLLVPSAKLKRGQVAITIAVSRGDVEACYQFLKAKPPRRLGYRKHKRTRHLENVCRAVTVAWVTGKG
jgi:hypothetical protein